MLLPFLAAQLAWLPLGGLAGLHRDVAAWSVCGEAMCVCLPDVQKVPTCALCPEGGPSTCGAADQANGVASVAERRTDTSDSQDLQLALAAMLSALVAVPDPGSAARTAGDGERPVVAASFEAVRPASRSLDPAMPPPWA